MPSDLEVTTIKHSDASGDNITLYPSNNVQFAGNLNLGGTYTQGTIGDDVVFPAGHVIQMITSKSVETNALTTSYVNLFEVSITLKGGNSKVLILHNFNYYEGSGSGLGLQIRKKTSSGVGTSDTAVWTDGTVDGTGPLHWYYEDAGSYNTGNIHVVDDATSHSAGDAIYYGFFFRMRSGTVAVPPDNNTDGYLQATLLEFTA